MYKNKINGRRKHQRFNIFYLFKGNSSFAINLTSWREIFPNHEDKMTISIALPL